MTGAVRFAPIVSAEVVEEMRRIGALRWPEEAVGFLMPPIGDARVQVVELLNHSASPKDSIELPARELERGALTWLKRLEALGVAPPDELDPLIWHTHPGGGVGPSRSDMRSRPPSSVRCLVVPLRPPEDSDLPPLPVTEY